MKIWQIIVTTYIFIIIQVNGDCVLYGECPNNNEFALITESPPFKGELTENALSILEKRCSELYDGGT